MTVSNEYDIRACVIRYLLADGWKREDLRIEIPLDTASSNGRADILCLGKDYIGHIDLSVIEPQKHAAGGPL